MEYIHSQINIPMAAYTPANKKNGRKPYANGIQRLFKSTP